MPRKATAVIEEPRAEPGTVLAEGVVEGRPCGWKAPPLVLGKDGRRRVAVWDRNYKRYAAYLEAVRIAGLVARSRRCPYGGPVRFELTVYAHRRGREQVGDLTNYLKSTEDGLNSIVFKDDEQVREQYTRLVIDPAERQRVEFRVVAL